ncbi:hypothetical protein A2801_04415 [Candidatus Woesebacteria bacterium RIFCSPHIGHO2_01_FULL_41_10]|uniref:Uncharacterized protein n=1 Tax=Candidatus Woesebacteria bacterium RIFCSPHIGHO2_01_FULL_41_10 TaxID=1802500 RepID=A0A1F7YMX1_9BACT|nr:MAG: hypothetical protein A2801_04415 [Candidatus Woesebacteria bacterium RIFCSPHIGHO2_01_FULL_41_10]
MSQPQIRKSFSSNTISVLFVKRKQVFLGRIFLVLLGVFVLYFWLQLNRLDSLFILLYIGLLGLFFSMNNPYGFIHNISLPFLFLPYIILPALINQTGLVIVLCGLLLATVFYLKNKKKINAFVQIALLAPTTIFIVIFLLTT